ncbi:MAG: DNA polymerase I [Lachnospiraceae bacterium]|nr:DNA polymerase I [Lachnospiraceae bacterium]
MDKIVLIDGNSILCRAYFGLSDLTTSKGVHTNGVKGFLNILFKLIEEEKPKYMGIAFDLPEPTFRHLKFKEYKAQRKPMDEALLSQFPILEDLLRAMGIFVMEKAGFEADDLIGTAATICAEKGLEVSAVSGDKDLLQLATDRIKVRIPTTAKGQTVIKDYNNEEFAAEFGLEKPSMIIDLKAIMGDSSDNYKGVEGIGKVGATKLLQEFGSLDGIYENLDKIKGANHDKLEKSKDDAYFCRWLATIKTDCDFGFDLKKAEFGNIFTPKAYALFKELEFKSFLGKFSEEARTEVTSVASEQISLPEPPLKVIKEASGFASAFDELKKENGEFVGLSFAASDNEDGYSKEIVAAALECGSKAFCLITSCKNEEEILLNGIRSLISDKKKLAVCDIKEISEKFTEIKDDILDLALVCYLLYPGKNSYTECDVTRDLAGSALPEVKEVFGKMTLTEAVLDNSFTGEMTAKAAELLGHYAHGICVSASKGVRELKEKEMYDLYKDVELPLMFDLREMEAAGIGIDRNALKEYGSFLNTDIQKEEKEIYKIAGGEFNINSPKQLGEVLFEKLKLPGGKKTKSGYSTAAEVLEKLRYEDPIVDKILKYRELTKLKSTYADGLGAFICPDGRIHTKFNQTVTMTGRLSSTDPNLQNIPVRRESGREIRKMFVPKDGCCFVDADYSQIELRLLAHMSGDESLIQAYSSGQDIHRITAAKVFGVEPGEVTKEMRSNAKAVNFGIIYGMSSFGLGQEIHVSRKDAEAYIKQYFATYPAIKNYLDSLVEFARNEGYSITLYKRRRPIPDIKASNFMVRQGAERIAMNTPIQGTAADIMKIALVNVNRALKEHGLKSKILLQVHDELLLEVPNDEKEEVKKLVAEEMMKAADLRVKLEVSVAAGENWDAAH